MRGHYFFQHLIRDIVVIVGSVIVAVFLFKLGIVEVFVAQTGGSALSAFFVGLFFTSVFTVAPAAVALGAISQSFPLFSTAFFGALGALFLDMIIISFVRNDISKDLDSAIKEIGKEIGTNRPSIKRFVREAFKFGILKWAALVFGVLIVASPLPDEFGLLLIGLSKVQTWILVITLFIAHFLGILALTSIISFSVYI